MQSSISTAGCLDRWRSKDHYGGPALSWENTAEIINLWQKTKWRKNSTEVEKVSNKKDKNKLKLNWNKGKNTIKEKNMIIYINTGKKGHFQ